MRSLRRSVYWKFGEPITLAFVSCVVDFAPELTTATPAPTAPPPKLKFERAPRWSERNVRRAMGRDRKQGARALRKVGFERTMRRIMREGA